MNCELCDLEKITKWLYQDKEYIILLCKTCNIPMVVTTKHEVRLVEEEVEQICDVLFKKYRFRKEQRKVKNHEHWHILVDI